MRFALGFAVWTMTLLVSRLTNGTLATTASWLWFAVLGVITAATLPGLSPYFVFPALVAAVLLLATARRGWTNDWGQAALFVSALAAFVIWIGLVVSRRNADGPAAASALHDPTRFCADDDRSASSFAADATRGVEYQCCRQRCRRCRVRDRRRPAARLQQALAAAREHHLSRERRQSRALHRRYVVERRRDSSPFRRR